MPANNAPPSGGVQGVNIRPSQSSPPRVSSAAGLNKPGISTSPNPLIDESKMRPLPGAAEIAAKNKAQPTSNPIDEPPAPETISSAPAAKEESIDAAKEVTAEPAAEPAVAPSEEVRERLSERRHRGSEVFDAPLDEIRRIENENALREEDEDEEEVTTATSGIASVKFNEGEKVQEQDAKEPADASKSVED